MCRFVRVGHVDSENFGIRSFAPNRFLSARRRRGGRAAHPRIDRVAPVTPLPPSFSSKPCVTLLLRFCKEWSCDCSLYSEWVDEARVRTAPRLRSILRGNSSGNKRERITARSPRSITHRALFLVLPPRYGTTSEGCSSERLVGRLLD
jgi:hypothetical protein